jgi:hypothetical protein
LRQLQNPKLFRVQKWAVFLLLSNHYMRDEKKRIMSLSQPDFIMCLSSFPGKNSMIDLAGVEAFNLEASCMSVKKDVVRPSRMTISRQGIEKELAARYQGGVGGRNAGFSGINGF